MSRQRGSRYATMPPMSEGSAPVFNPPPNWPVSRGWQPGAGWVPDPSWPPAPPDWQFWVSQPTEPERGPRRSRLLWVLAAIGTVAAVAVAALIVVSNNGRPGAGPDPGGTGFGAVSTVHVDNQPTALARDPESGDLYAVTGRGLVVVDVADRTIGNTIEVPTALSSDVAIDPVAAKAWVTANDRENGEQAKTVSIVDTRAGSVVGTVTLPNSAMAVAIDTTRRRVFVVHRPDDQRVLPEGDSWVSVFDADSHARIDTVEVPIPAYDLALDTETARAIVVGAMGATILRTDNLQIEDAGIRPRSSSTSVAIDPKTHVGFVISSDDIFQINLSDGTLESHRRAPAEPGPGQLAVDPNHSLVMIDSHGDGEGKLLVVDPTDLRTVTSTQLGGGWSQLAIDPSDGQIFVTDITNGTVDFIPRQ